MRNCPACSLRPIATCAVVLPELDPQRLWMWVFGPGVGELVVVRAPPGKWLIIDGCRAKRVSYAERLLDYYEAEPDIVVLTHPHRDHAGGVADLVNRFADEDDPDSWPLLGMIEPPDTRGAGRAGDQQAAYEGGVVERAVAAIQTRWDRNPACRWAMEVGDRMDLGEAVITVLSPEPAAREKAATAYRQDKRVEWNEVSTALLLEWQSTRLVLGSDLVEKPGGGWSAVLEPFRDARTHDGLKVPHHGSAQALLPALLDDSSRSPRAWIVTPFASQRLPRFDRKGGMALLHEHERDVLLTATPRAYDEQGGAPGQLVSRAELERVMKRGESLDPLRPGFPDCFVGVGFARGGEATTVPGPGSLLVRQRRRRRLRR